MNNKVEQKFEINKLTKQIIKVIKKASKIYLNKTYFELVEKHKFLNDDVTNLDIKTQSYIKKECLKIIPNSNFIGEEGQQLRNSNYTWILDPIDGTFNFKKKIDMYGTQICLLYKNEPIISVLYLPTKKELYYANEFGAFMNDKKIKVSEATNLDENITLLGDYDESVHLDVFNKIHNTLVPSIKRIRMLGSSCVDNCFIASGKADTYIIYSVNKWDLLPGQYLVKQAGGFVWTNKDKNIHISGNELNVLKLIKLLELK